MTNPGTGGLKLAEEIKELKQKISELEDKQLKFVEVNVGNINISANGFANIPVDKIPGTRTYLFATVSYFGITSKKACFSVHGAGRAFGRLVQQETQYQIYVCVFGICKRRMKCNTWET